MLASGVQSAYLGGGGGLQAAADIGSERCNLGTATKQLEICVDTPFRRRRTRRRRWTAGRTGKELYNLRNTSHSQLISHTCIPLKATLRTSEVAADLEVAGSVAAGCKQQASGADRS